jgi:cytochrome bd-type quinol oxidase subunit 1
VKLFIVALLLAACVPPTPYMHQRQNLLYGSDAAIYAGCVRGVIRWHVRETGRYPTYAHVEALCNEVQKSYQEKWRDNGDI